jgi:hypothetical protein
MFASMPQDAFHPQRTISELVAMHLRLSDLFEDLSHFERVWRPEEGKWSCTEVMGHLVDAEIAFAFRIRTALAEPGKALGAFAQDAWVAAQRWNEKPVSESLHVFHALRQATVTLLEGLSEEQLRQHYVHEIRGPQSIADTASLLAWHDSRHLVQLGRTAELARDASQRGTRAASRESSL